MPLSEHAAAVVRAAAAVILIACAASTAWAQQSYDSGSRYEYAYGEGLELRLRYDWSSLEAKPTPTPPIPPTQEEAGSPGFDLGLGWDVQPGGGLFGAWSDDQEEHEFTMEGAGGFLAPGLAHLMEDDSSDVSVDPPTIQFDDEDPSDSHSSPDFNVEYPFRDSFQFHLRYEDPSETHASQRDSGDTFQGELTIRPFFGEDASVYVDPPTLDLSAGPAGPDVQSVIPELAQPQQGRR